MDRILQLDKLDLGRSSFFTIVVKNKKGHKLCKLPQ